MIGTDVNRAPLDVRVPALGGYVFNKALTFMDRLSVSGDGVLKAAKDIVYMRDVMTGGDDVRTQVLSDIKALVKQDKSRLALIKTAEGRLRQLGIGTTSALDGAVSQLVVQQRFTSDGAARADLLGYTEILADLLGEVRPKRDRRK